MLREGPWHTQSVRPEYLGLQRIRCHDMIVRLSEIIVTGTSAYTSATPLLIRESILRSLSVSFM